MTKIFISHSTADKKMVTKLMDMLQTQFNLTRDDFFYTSDEELTVGGNWIEEIRQGMQDATLILPIITPNYLESHFCMCELGAAWVNQQALVPVIIPPLDHNALSATPYRTWMQVITLNSTRDLLRLGDFFINKNIGTGAQMVRFTSRAEELYNESVVPFISEMKKRETITPEVVKKLRQDLANIGEAYKSAEKEVAEFKSENQKLRNLKDAEEVKVMDYSKMSEWETFLTAVNNARGKLDNLHPLVTSILFNNNYKNGFSANFVGTEEDRQQLNVLEAEGYINWDGGWVTDDYHREIYQADKALHDLKNVIRSCEDIIEERFLEEFNGIRLGLNYSPFWEQVLDQKIYHSTR
jgi:hypothetical protein